MLEMVIFFFGPEIGTSLDLIVPLTISWSSVLLLPAITSMCASSSNRLYMVNTDN